MGGKLIAPESLPLDEILSIEAEDHLAFAEVRYSQPRGDKFTIGCERIHLLNHTRLFAPVRVGTTFDKGNLARDVPAGST